MTMISTIVFNKKKRSMMRKIKRITVHLPEDLVVEILSRVPLASLARLRSTSKGWNALIKDESFTKKHSANAPRQPLVLMLIESRIYLVSLDHNNVAPSIEVTSQINLKDPLSDWSKEVEIRGVFHCDGLLLCSTEDERLVVWNPYSGETKWIKPKETYKKLDYYALGKSSCNEYKILRVDQFGYMGPCLVKSEVYDSTSSSWRRVSKTTDWFIQRSMGRGVTVNGNTYWLANTPAEDLFCFDFSTERFGNVSLPGDGRSYYVFALSVTREDQQLCILATRNREAFDMDVWVATKIESTGAASWTKLLSVMERTYRPMNFRFCTGMSFLADRENKVIVCRGKHGASNDFLHIMGEDKCIRVVHHDEKSTCSHIVSYVPSFVQIHKVCSSLGTRKAPSTRDSLL